MLGNQPAPPPQRPPPAPNAWRWPVVVVLVTALGLAALLSALRGCRETPGDLVHAGGTEATRVLHAAGEEAGAALARFRQGTITKTFIESLPTFDRPEGGRLELVAVTVTETISRSDQLTTFWGRVDLGTTVAEIRVPATYRYYLYLHDDWKLDVNSNICIVHAPANKAALPVAHDTALLEKKSQNGWARHNAAEHLAALEQDLTSILNSYADDPRHLADVREQCRRTVAEFVRDWLLREKQWRDDRFTAVQVYFPDEPTPGPVRGGEGR